MSGSGRPEGKSLPTQVRPQVLIKPLNVGLIVLLEPLPEERAHAGVLALVRDGVRFGRPMRYFEKVQHALQGVRSVIE